MLKRMVFAVIGLFLIGSLCGCATTRSGQAGLEAQGLRNQITVLQSEIQRKNEMIISLRDALENMQAEGPRASRQSVQEKPTVKQIQLCLKNAGYNPGVIDGKMGKATRQAIREFQAANNLKADGKAGKQTWALLKEHLEKKVK